MRCVEVFNQKSQKKIRVIAIIDCDRERELKFFIKEYQWQHHAMIDDGLKKKMNISQSAICAIFDYNGKILRQFDYENLNICEFVKIIATVE